MSRHKTLTGKTWKTGKSSIILMSIMLLVLNALLVSATVDLVSPANNTHTNQQNISFEYYVGLENATNCTLILDSEVSEIDINITSSGFNTFSKEVNTGTHTWSVVCSSMNSSENSEQRTLTVDTIEPNLILVSPHNDTRINSTSADISFIVINTPQESSSCDIYLNSTLEESVTAWDSETTVTTLSNLADRGYEWQITCYDQANNSATSETREFYVNTTSPLPPVPEFIITIPKTEYKIGESSLMTISAPNGTNLAIEVCPDKPGFVECEIPVTGKNIMNYPFQEYLPFTNYAGEYLLEARFNYSGYLETLVLNYEVISNIHIDIDADKNPRRKVPLIIEAHATGGIGDLNYSWELSNDAKVNEQGYDWINITYNNAGNYTETVIVKDRYNNTKNKSITIDVSGAHSIGITVKDAITKKAVKGASVEIEDEQKETGTDGKVNYHLREGRREIIVMHENYSIYLDELNITKDKSYTILLQPLINSEPVVTLIRPQNNSGVSGTTTNLVFKAKHNTTVNCSIYINENNDGFFMYLGSLKVENKKEQKYGIMELENKTYWWKVECVDPLGNSGMSKTWRFIVGDNAQEEFISAQQETLETLTQTQDLSKYNNLAKEFELILDTLENLPNTEREAAEALGIIAAVKDTIKTLKNIARDVEAINRRNDLSEGEKQTEIDYLISNAEKTYLSTPTNIEVLGSDTFVDYINDQELEELIEEYIELELSNEDEELNKKQLLNFLKDLQQEVVISTVTKSARIKYKDGSQKEVTAVIRNIKTYNIPDNTYLIEVIPKSIAQTADRIISPEEFEVVKQDPIIRFRLKGDTTLGYYFEEKINPDLLKDIKSAILIDLDSLDKDQITGSATKGLGLSLPKIKLKGIIFIPILVILLGGLVFAGIKYNGLDTARYLFYKLHGQKSLHYLNVILYDIQDNLDVGNTAKALELYEEAKGAYEELSTIAKNDVYEKIVETAGKVGSYCQVTQQEDSMDEIKLMIKNISGLLNNGELEPALEEYKRIEAAYNQLGEKTKEMLHPSLVSLGNKIQIIIENEKNKI